MNSSWCVRYETRLFLTFSTILISNYFNIFFCHSLRYCQLGAKYLLCYKTVLIKKTVFRCTFGHGDWRYEDWSPKSFGCHPHSNQGETNYAHLPSFIPTIWNVDILHHKQANLRKDLQHSADTVVCKRV